MRSEAVEAAAASLLVISADTPSLSLRAPTGLPRCSDLISALTELSFEEAFPALHHRRCHHLRPGSSACAPLLSI